MSDVALRDCGVWLSGGTPDTGNAAFWGGDIPWITSSSLHGRYLDSSVRRITLRGLNTGGRLVPAGTLIFVVRGMSLKSEFRVGLAVQDIAFGQDCKALIPHSWLLPKYLLFALEARESAILRMVDEASHGTGRLQTSLLGSLPVQVPPLDEQRRVVEILDTIDETIQGAERVIAKLRTTRWGLICAHALAPSGTDTNADSKVSDFGDVVGGRQLSPSQSRGINPTPYLRVANVFLNRIDFNDVLSMDFTEQERTRYYLRHGDILLNEGQSLELVGRSAVFVGPDNAYCFQNTLVRFRAHRNVISPGYAQLIFEQWLNRGDFQKVAFRTTSIAHLGSERFAKMSLQVPPLDVQNASVQIVSTVDSTIRLENERLRRLRQVRSGLATDLLFGRVRTVAA